MRETFPALIDHYGGMSAALAADVFESHAIDVGLTPRVEVAAGVNEDRAVSRLFLELSATTSLGKPLQLVDELVKQPYRSTYQDSAVNSGGGWARVPRGDTCNFCIMLASRGGVYSKDTVIHGWHGKKYHGDCDCQPVLVRDESDYPTNYDPDALYDKYKAAWNAAGGTGVSGRMVAREMRRMYGGR